MATKKASKKQTEAKVKAAVKAKAMRPDGLKTKLSKTDPVDKGLENRTQNSIQKRNDLLKKRISVREKEHGETKAVAKAKVKANNSQYKALNAVAQKKIAKNKTVNGNGAWSKRNLTGIGAPNKGAEISDYEKLARKLGVGVTADYSATKDYLNSSATQQQGINDAAYGALGRSYAADTTKSNAAYDSGLASSDAAMNQAKASNQAAVASLGLDKASAINQNGGQDAAYYNQLLGNQQAQNNATFNQQKAAAATQNEGFANAAVLENQTQNSGVRTDLAAQLAQIQQQQATDKVDAQNNIFNGALQLNSIDSGNQSAAATAAYNQQDQANQAAQQNFENQLATNKFAQSQQQAAGSGGDGLSTALSQYGNLTSWAAKNGVSKKDLRGIIQNLGSLSNIK